MRWKLWTKRCKGVVDEGVRNCRCVFDVGHIGNCLCKHQWKYGP